MFKLVKFKLVKFKPVQLFSVGVSLLIVLSMILLGYLFSSTESKESNNSTDRKPDNWGVFGLPPTTTLPVGTHLTIPPWIMQQFHTGGHANLYGDVLNFTLLNYGVAAPSRENTEKDTYYVPLSRYQKNDYKYDSYDKIRISSNSRKRKDSIMVDVTKIKILDSKTPRPLKPDPSPSKAPKEPKTTEEPSSQTTLSNEGSEVAKPSPQAVTPPSDVVFVTTEEIDTKKAPPVPVEKPLVDLSKPATAQATCDPAEFQTEAQEHCPKCVEQPKVVQEFLNIVDTTTETFTKNKNFPAVIRGLCDRCEGINVSDFFSYMEERGTAESVPKEILFAIMMRESNGNCEVAGDGRKSHGLFQLNITNSTKLRSCKKGELRGKNHKQMKQACTNGNYRATNKYKKITHSQSLSKRSNIGAMVCLQNPYCNFEEALHLLKDEKWGIGNGEIDIPKSKTSWVDLNAEERNQWRNAIIAYNGDFYHQKAKQEMRQNLKLGANARLDDWELKRIFFIKQYLSGSQKIKKGLIHNLAYVESIAGRETEQGMVKSSICQWAQFRKNNKSMACP